MIGPFFTSLRCLKVLEEKGSQGPKNEYFEKIKNTSPGIHPFLLTQTKVG